MCQTLQLTSGRVPLRMDAHLEQLLDPLLTPRAARTKSTVAHLSGQLLWTVGVTAVHLRAREREWESEREKIYLRKASQARIQRRCNFQVHGCSLEQKRDKLEPLISSRHNRNLNIILFSISKKQASHVPLLYPSTEIWLKLDAVKKGKRTTWGFKASNCWDVAVVIVLQSGSNEQAFNNGVMKQARWTCGQRRLEWTKWT